MATIHAKDTVLERIDRVPVRGSAFEILPGPHALLVRLQVSGQDPFTPGLYYSKGGLVVCFTARPGRAYTIVPAFVDDGWQPEIVDRATTYRITVRYAMPGTGACPGERPSAPALAAGPPGVPAGTPQAGDGEGASGEAVPGPVEGLGVSPRGQVHGQEAPPPPRPHRPPSSTSAQVPRREVRPGTGVGLEAGLFAGGTELVRAERSNGDKEKLTAGGGVLLALALMVTPLWVESSVGFGLGLNAGWKGDSIEGSNGNITFWRLPLSATFHALIPLGTRWFLLPRRRVRRLRCAPLGRRLRRRHRHPALHRPRHPARRRPVLDRRSPGTACQSACDTRASTIRWQAPRWTATASGWRSRRTTTSERCGRSPREVRWRCCGRGWRRERCDIATDG